MHGTNGDVIRSRLTWYTRNFHKEEQWHQAACLQKPNPCCSTQRHSSLKPQGGWIRLCAVTTMEITRDAQVSNVINKELAQSSCNLVTADLVTMQCNWEWIIRSDWLSICVNTVFLKSEFKYSTCGQKDSLQSEHEGLRVRLQPVSRLSKVSTGEKVNQQSVRENGPDWPLCSYWLLPADNIFMVDGVQG